MIDVKNDVYVIYQGREFKYLTKQNDQVVLLSHDPKDKESGFKEVYPQSFNKTVALTDLETAYKCNTKALYKDIECTVADVEGNHAYLEYAEDYVKAKERGFKLVEPPTYEKMVMIKQLDKVWYIKKPVWGFTIQENEQIVHIK